MPKSLDSIEKAADMLEQACKDMKRDPFSKSGRDRLIAGSRGILQGTTAMLVIFDESQVRNPFKHSFFQIAGRAGSFRLSFIYILFKGRSHGN
jgi:hypothetical protein